MGCQGEVTIGANLTWSITTHDPDTGVLTDTDFQPIYRIYRNEVAAPILTGTMAALDNPNTTGFYSEQIVCVAANGFLDEDSYNIYIEATVDGDTGGISYGFVARLADLLCFDVALANALAGYGVVTANVGTDGYGVAIGNAPNLVAAASNTRFCP